MLRPWAQTRRSPVSRCEGNCQRLACREEPAFIWRRFLSAPVQAHGFGR